MNESEEEDEEDNDGDSDEEGENAEEEEEDVEAGSDKEEEARLTALEEQRMEGKVTGTAWEAPAPPPAGVSVGTCIHEGPSRVPRSPG